MILSFKNQLDGYVFYYPSIISILDLNDKALIAFKLSLRPRNNKNSITNNLYLQHIEQHITIIISLRID